MARYWAAVFIVCGLGCAATPAAAKSAWQAGHRRAAKLGYSEAQAACFADVFERYASLNPRGNYVVQARRSRRSPFAAEVWNNCRVYW